MTTTWNAVSTLDRMFDDMMGSALGAAANPRTYNPKIDVRTTEDALVFECDVPGVKQEDLDVTLHEHVLTIKGTRKDHGSFSRSFALPSAFDEEKLTADLADGVLVIRIPKVPKAKPFKVQIGGKALDK